MSTSIHTACPHIVPIEELDIRPEYNKPIIYKCNDGTEYVFYDHTDPDGHIARVQFCKRIGRKKDVFQCLNEGEWRVCPAAKDVCESIPQESEWDMAMPSCCGKPVGIGTGPLSIAAGGIVVYCLLPPAHEGPCDPCPGYSGSQHPPLFLEGEAADRVIELMRRRGKVTDS